MNVIEVEEPDDNNYEETGRTVCLSNFAYVKCEDEKTDMQFTIVVPFTLTEYYSADDDKPPKREVVTNIEEAELSDEDSKLVPDISDHWKKLCDFDAIKKEVQEAIEDECYK